MEQHHEPADSYEAIAEAASAMAAAARSGDRNAWVSARAVCLAAIERARSVDAAPVGVTLFHPRRLRLLKRILADDAEIRRACSPSYARVEALLAAGGDPAAGPR